MPLLGGFKLFAVGWAGRSAIYVAIRVGTASIGRVAQLYVNRRLAGVVNIESAGLFRVDGQVWDAQKSAAPINIILVEPQEAYTDFGDALEVDPWNRYTLTWTVPDDYTADTHHFQVLGALNFDTEPTAVIANVPYVGPRTYSLSLPAIPSLPMPVPSPTDARSRWQPWYYRVVPHDNASPAGNAGTPTDITIPALIYPADLVIRGDGSRFTASVLGSTLTLGYTVPA